LLFRTAYTALTLISLASAPAEPIAPLACAGPFAKTTSHARIVAAFGETNVTFSKVDGPENLELDATVIFPDDPVRRVEITWHDSKRTRPHVIKIDNPSTWVAPLGVRIGATLEDIEKRNGAAFQISGFGWDNEGLTAFRGGRLAKIPGGCALGLRFEPAQNPLDESLRRINEDREFPSNDLLMREANPKVVEIFLSYKDTR
jgi:hypothetical protein